jgi:UDP-N-acetylmuramyl pentapeptide phosphotransferase/UDP-N-acetylglucosamine-1-phosphate transferase
MIDLLTALLTFAIVSVLATAAVGLTRRYLLRHQILDRPNDRSSHETPTPRGGGIGVVAVLLAAWVSLPSLAAAAPAWGTSAAWITAAAALGLALVSWIDDLRDLGALSRLFTQFAAAAAGVALLPGPVFQGLLPAIMDPIVAAVGLVWFVNLFNFMDGIDGISAVEAMAIGLGIAGVGLLGAGEIAAWHGQAIAAAAAAAGFLVWNWHPARIFLGDVGSVPLGYLLGWLLLLLAATGEWEAAAILPLYYLADATLTLFRRLWRRERVWQAHREHFYQLATRRGLSHARVSGAIAALNIVLVLLALAAASPELPASVSWIALGAACGLVASFLVWLAGRPQSG